MKIFKIRWMDKKWGGGPHISIVLSKSERGAIRMLKTEEKYLGVQIQKVQQISPNKASYLGTILSFGKQLAT